ncbi:MAG TPA: TMEM43 family protein, partial [Myxococcaceae bacterium]|nr:TMEM43 family protein [Myxococcaceae bacterium]
LSRITQSVGGAVLGAGLFIAAFPLLYWNEGRAVQTMKSLEEGQGALVKASADRVDPQNELKLVQLSGETQTRDVLRDPDFGVKAQAIRLLRDAEMYQWKENRRSETRKKLGGGEETVTTYSYEKAWVDHLLDSGRYKETGHDNPGSMKYESKKLEASNVTLGAYRLSGEQISKIGGAATLEVGSDAPLENAPRRAKVKADGVVYVGESPDTPRIGDERISFRVVKPGPLSVIGQQTGDTFQPYQTKAGDALLLVQDGIHAPGEMFQKAQADNATLTWILRVVGFALMLIGLAMAFKPLSVLADVVPFIGSMVGAGMGVFAFLISVALSLLTIGLAWVAHRPLLGVPLLLVSGGALYLVFARGRKKLRAKAGWTPGLGNAA